MVASIILFAFPRFGLGFLFGINRLLIKGAMKNCRINLALSNNSVQNPTNMYLWTWRDSFGVLFSAMDKNTGEKGKIAVY